MSRHRPGSAYGHGVRRIGPDHWRMSWTYDRYYEGSRQRFPRTMTRDTDGDGARRFAAKWGLPKPAFPPGEGERD